MALWSVLFYDAARGRHRPYPQAPLTPPLCACVTYSFLFTSRSATPLTHSLPCCTSRALGCQPPSTTFDGTYALHLRTPSATCSWLHSGPCTSNHPGTTSFIPTDAAAPAALRSVGPDHARSPTYATASGVTSRSKMPFPCPTTRPPASWSALLTSQS